MKDYGVFKFTVRLVEEDGDKHPCIPRQVIPL
jgi:hypothetical protein